jgi:nucleoid DNA-binding protein
MTRSELAGDWRERFMMTPAHAQSCVDELYRDFCAALATGGEVQLRGIGTWKTVVRKNGRRAIQLRASGTLVRAANRMPPRSKAPKASSLPIPKQPSARIPMLIAQIFDKWPSRKFLQRVGGIAGLDSGRLLRILEEMVRRGMRYDPDFTVPFLDVLQQQFCL